MIKNNLRLIINNLIMVSIEILYFLYSLLEQQALAYIYFGVGIVFLFLKVLVFNDKYSKKAILINDVVLTVGVALIFIIVELITHSFTFNFGGKIIFNIFFVLYLLNIILIDITIYKNSKRENSK